MTGSRKSGAALLFATLLAAAMPGPQGEARAQPAPPPGGDAVQKLQEFRGTGASRDMETVPQTGRRADQIRRNLERIRLPEGFRIGLYALVPDARHMAVGPSSGVVFVGTRKNRIWAVTDRDRDRVADEVKVFAPSVTLSLIHI